MLLQGLAACAPSVPLPPAGPAGQHLDLPEWLDYHRRLGVSHFYLMDDSSDPPLDDLLRSYVQASSCKAEAACGVAGCSCYWSWS